jgi:transcriptional regulator with XRE-family HTH domain
MEVRFVTSQTTPMDQKLLLGKNIRCFRTKLGLTQEQLAKYLEVSREEVNYYENGSRSIPSVVISKAAQLFGVDEYDLYQDDPELISANLAFAFRGSLEDENLKHIAEFQKIVKNYIQMKKVVSNDEHCPA